MPSLTPLHLFLIIFVLAFCVSQNGVYAFGAGNIPSFAYLEGKAFRHGDIEDILADLVKKGSTGFALSSLIKHKFNGLDIKRVYFGNWLRDYSQAVDIAGLKKLELQTIINLCMVLGFMAHGYATNEFEVTIDRLGCYLPTEHIDNPKGYGDGEDARQYDRRLRGPVDPRELEVDPQTGMKNYIANERGHWDTSKALVRRTLEKCIQLGRQNRNSPNKPDDYESLRLLGTALHTLEDFSAHSNFCELALVNLGYTDVFTHVGDHVRIHAPNGKMVAPLVTGTFGGSDFMHSLLGEAGDHLSQASVTDLNQELEKARTKQFQNQTRGGPGEGNPVDTLRTLLFTIPSMNDGEMSQDLANMERIRAGAAGGGQNPETMSPQELHATLWQILSFRDRVAKKISKTIEKIPGLGPMIERLSESISVFVFTTLEPFVKPLLKTATSGLQNASSEVINSHDQYEVFNDPRASDPTHSFLSKDHFNLILNEPAGLIAKAIVTHTVNLVVKAWDDPSMNVHHVTEEILVCLFHPDFHNPNSQIQRQMMQTMVEWINGKGHRKNEILSRLTKNAVRNHENIRLAGEGGPAAAIGTAAYSEGVAAQHKLTDYLGSIPVVGQAQGVFNQFTGGSGNRRDGTTDGYGAPSGPPPSSHNYGSGSGGEAAAFYGGGRRPDPPSTLHPLSHSGGYNQPPPSIPSHTNPYSSHSSPAHSSAYPTHPLPSPASPYSTHSLPTPASAYPTHPAPFGRAPHLSDIPDYPTPNHPGYQPAYISGAQVTSSAPQFPGSGHGHTSFPSASGPAFPDTNAPSFPGAHNRGNDGSSFPQFPGSYSAW